MQGTESGASERAGESRFAGLGARAAALVDRIPLALAVVVLIAALLRIALELSYRPLVLSFPDSGAYMQMAHDSMFDDPGRMVGYPVFLEIVHWLSANVERTIEIQHILGLVTGVLLYATVRRLGAPIWVALIGAAAVLFSLDQIKLEHMLATEAPFTCLYAGALYCSVRGLDSGRELAGALGTRELWLLGAGLLLGAAIWLRGMAIVLIPFIAVWGAFAIPGNRLARVGRAALLATPAVALVLLYMAMNSSSSTGNFGLIQADGRGIYSRTAQFADCSHFDPPAGTEELCETTPGTERPATHYYSAQEDSPAYEAFGPPPGGDEELGDFGWAAIGAQPLDFIDAAGSDFVGHFFPELNRGRPFSDIGLDLELSYRIEEVEDDLRNRFFGVYYDPVGPVEVTGFAGVLEDAQALLRAHPVLLAQAALLALLGLWAARGRPRAGIVLLGGSALVLLAATATAAYAARYAVPVAGPLIAAGAIGLWALLQRYVRT